MNDLAIAISTELSVLAILLIRLWIRTHKIK